MRNFIFALIISVTITTTPIFAGPPGDRGYEETTTIAPDTVPPPDAARKPNDTIIVPKVTGQEVGKIRFPVTAYPTRNDVEKEAIYPGGHWEVADKYGKLKYVSPAEERARARRIVGTPERAGNGQAHTYRNPPPTATPKKPQPTQAKNKKPAPKKVAKKGSGWSWWRWLLFVLVLGIGGFATYQLRRFAGVRPAGVMGAITVIILLLLWLFM